MLESLLNTIWMSLIINNMALTLIAYYLIFIPVGALGIIGIWKTYKKTGVPGWSCIVPVYGTYLLFRISKLKRPVLHTVVHAIITTVASVLIFKHMWIFGTVYAGTAGALKTNLLRLLPNLPAQVLFAVSHYKLARCFDRSKGFGIGYAMFPGLFSIILGFGKAKYLYKPEEPAVPQVECAEPAALPESASSAEQPEEGSGQSSESMKQKNEQTKLEGEV